MARISIIGGGVIGLTVAHELTTHGHDVTVIAARDHRASVSSVAAAIWFPHAVTETPRILASAKTTFRRLAELSRDPRTGAHLREGVVLSRSPDPDLSWTDMVPDWRPADEPLPPGTTGIRCSVPLAVTDVYLAWLHKEVEGRGVRFETRTITDLTEVTDCDAVVIAAGLGSATLLGDPDVYPIRGQVVRLANPGLTDWLLDDDNPAGLTYVVPRDTDVVCGGTGEVNSWDESPHPDTEAAILARATALVPALANQPVVSRAAGLRPARTTVRLELIPGHPRPVIACYGHGGSGFTLSWGEAAEVAHLINTQTGDGRTKR
jgi:D-amino-acid oxidase